MSFCVERGIPHSVFLGREDHDDSPRWLESDRAKVLALLAEDGERCPSCGTAAWEWDTTRGGSRHAYVPEKHVCEGCNRKEHVREEDDPKGTFIVLVPQNIHVERELARQRGAS